MIRKLKKELLASVKNKRLNVFLLFLSSSFVILIFTKLSKEYTNTVAFEVKKINVPQDKVILNDSNNSVDIRLKTHGFKWLQYYLTKPQIAVDFSNEVYRTGSSYVFAKSVSYLNEKKQFQNQVKLLSIAPDTLMFRFDTNMVKKVPVLAKAEIQFAPGFDMLNEVEAYPDSIVVVGPHDMVESLQGLETELVQLDNVKTDISKKARLKLPKNRKDLKFSLDEVELVADVEKFTEGTVKIPIRVINVPDSISIKCFPKEVNVSYYTSLEYFNTVKPKDFRVICDYKKAEQNQSFLITELVRFPENVKRIKLSQQRIEFIIVK
ncbi:CdaR family protein [Hyunsoonleella aquatilis]|uniref:CdaR family protein n=1 Tax=Hyunsoonleella aquatilis TaxID=2762758 RepID=UPI0031B6104B